MRFSLSYALFVIFLLTSACGRLDQFTEGMQTGLSQVSSQAGNGGGADDGRGEVSGSDRICRHKHRNGKGHMDSNGEGHYH